jgi:hypothetical protein
MRDKIKESLIAHAEGHIKKHSANVEIYLNNAIGSGEHSDILETIEKELQMIAKYISTLAECFFMCPSACAIKLSFILSLILISKCWV